MDTIIWDTQSMELVWKKGPFSWKASLPEKADPPNNVFKLSEPPDDSAIVRLCVRLLELGGHAVVVLFSEQQANAFLLKESIIIAYDKVQLQLGRASECHANSALLWQKNKERFRLVTGYALSDDGLWRRHSWVSNKNTIIETTEERTLYFGAVLNDEQANAFYQVYSEYD